MADSVYPDGMPHPAKSLRRRVAIELSALALLTSIFLSFERARNLGTFLGMALIGAALVGFNARETRERIWGVPSSPDFDRVRRCTLNMTLLTIPPVLAFFVYALIAGHALITIDFLLTLAIYLPWALLQQTLFQFYLLGRLRVLLPFASPLYLSVLNGVVYGLVHISPDRPESNIPTVLLTMIGGVFWSYSYHRDRYVLPIAVSHALLATTFFFWVLNHDLIQSLAQRFF